MKADNLVIAESASGESTPTLVVDNGTVSGSITVENGTVKGSGTLGALTMNGGELVVGNSPQRTGLRRRCCAERCGGYLLFG